jgi:hypothetical protein
LFTGRRVDILDNGSLKIQYNRNRYYDYYTGRWLTHDPLGINPAGVCNDFCILQRETNVSWWAPHYPERGGWPIELKKTKMVTKKYAK